VSGEQFYFDAAAADRVVKFFPACLVHAKGKWAGQPFELLDWQKTIVRDLFGWKRADGTRRYRTAYISVPRKCGKTTLGAGLGLYLTTADGENGAECYSAAADRDQAAIMFDIAKSMVQSSPVLTANIKTFRRSMVYHKAASSYKVLSADAPTKHGLNAHGILFDELHAQRSRELWDVLTTSTGARTQPLTIAITTAGYDFESICYEIYTHACAVRDGLIEDPAFYTCIFEAGEEDDWRSPATWEKAHPSYGVTVQRSYFEDEVAKAEHSLAAQATLKRLMLNMWTRQREQFIDIEAWDACAAPVDTASLAGRRCYGGLDLANTTDINAFVLVFEPEDEDAPYDVVPYFWIPEERMRQRVQRDRVPYDAWVNAGFIETTPGDIADHRHIQRRICEIRDEFQVLEIAFDRWGSTQISTGLTDEGFTMASFGQGFASMASPTKELLKLVCEKRIRHGGNPVLRWMISNLTVKQDEAGNFKPDKARSAEKIDGVVALVMALDRTLRHEAEPDGPSVYEERGAFVL